MPREDEHLRQLQLQRYLQPPLSGLSLEDAPERAFGSSILAQQSVTNETRLRLSTAHTRTTETSVSKAVARHTFCVPDAPTLIPPAVGISTCGRVEDEDDEQDDDEKEEEDNADCCVKDVSSAANARTEKA
jgi:hypothetical protein